MLLAHQVPADELAAADRWRRALQLCLAGLWLLDSLLQIQVFMFSRGFADSVATRRAAIRQRSRHRSAGAAAATAHQTRD
jgi:hypothetical protein